MPAGGAANHVGNRGRRQGRACAAQAAAIAMSVASLPAMQSEATPRFKPRAQRGAPERVTLRGGGAAAGVCALLSCALVSPSCEGIDVLGGVFISYRREDSGAWAGRVYDRLAKRLGSKNVFLDVGNIQPGLDFVDVLTKRVAACDALVAIIGKDWISAADKDNRRRLDNPHDYVRIEIEAALERGVRVIPVLVQGTAMPKADELPDTLKKLANRQGIEVSLDRFDSDVKRLTRALALLEKELRPRDVTQAALVMPKPPDEQGGKKGERERPRTQAAEAAPAPNAVLRRSRDDPLDRPACDAYTSAWGPANVHERIQDLVVFYVGCLLCDECTIAFKYIILTV